jgi:putative ABC transport system permease protein
MNLIAIKMLVGDRMKYFALVLGVAFASLLITQQASIFTGYALQTGAWIRDTDVADLWVMDPQVEFADDAKPIQNTMLNRVRGIDGVEWAVPMFKGYVTAQLPDGTQRNVRLIGLDDTTLIGGPPEMVQGVASDLRKDKAIFINAEATDDLILKQAKPQRPLRVGDSVSLHDNEAVVVGTYRASREFFWEPVFYTTYSRAQFVYKENRKHLQYVLVRVTPGQSVVEVQKRINEATGLKALTSREFENETMWWILMKTGILINFGITIGLGLVIGLLVAGQTFYTFILDNLRNFGALKAMGVGNWRILGMIAVQVLVVAAVGFGLGAGGAATTGLAFKNVGLAFLMTWPIVLVGFGSILVCCLLAGLMSIVRVLKLEPGVVFR